MGRRGCPKRQRERLRPTCRHSGRLLETQSRRRVTGGGWSRAAKTSIPSSSRTSTQSAETSSTPTPSGPAPRCVRLWPYGAGFPTPTSRAHGLLDGEITRLSELRVAAQAARIDADLALGRHADLVGEIEALTSQHPYSEKFRAQHMIALYRSGRQTEALRSFQEHRSVLIDELGVEPSSELRDLELRVLEQDKSLSFTAARQVQRKAILVADPGDPIEVGHLPEVEREELLGRTGAAIESAIRRDGVAMSMVSGATTFVVFDEPHQAAAAAESVALKLDHKDLRLAIDWGDVEVDETSVVGPPVSRAAVMAAAAHHGQIVLSADAQHAIGSSGDGRGMRFETLGSYELHGVEGDLLIYQLLVGAEPGIFPDLVVSRVPPPLPGSSRPVPGYEIREQVGVGSVGNLYRAFQPSAGREVLVELIGQWQAADPGFIRRFEADVQRLSVLDHQNIATVIDYWRRPDGAYIVYRYPRGGFLSHASGFDASKVVEQIGAALAYAHSLGITHGSLTPDRVILDEAGNAALLGFPIANLLPGGGVTNPAYTAPETLAGEPPTPATDVYSLGVLAYELLEGDINSDRALISENPAVARALSESPADRQDSVVEFLLEFDPSTDSRSDRLSSVRNPYKGLSAFYESDASDFFGRTAETSQLVDLIGQSNFVTVVGPSGIGKSSLVRAGLIPELRRGAIEGSGDWVITDLLPGPRPFLELQRALERVAVDIPPSLRENLTRRNPDSLAGISDILPGQQRGGHRRRPVRGAVHHDRRGDGF